MELGIGGRNAIVGGSSRGLGFAIARALVAEGVNLALTARGEARLHEAVEELTSEDGPQVVGIPADLSTAGGVEAVVAGARESLGQIDILVTNTGGPPPGAFEEHDIDRWRAAYAGLLESVVRFTGALLPGMRERGWGRIVNVTSIAVKQPVDGLILSNTFRAGVTGLARTLANEVASDGVTVNSVMPGYTRTERLGELAAKLGEDAPEGPAAAFRRWEAEIPAARLGEPEELAALVAFLCSERAAYITGTSIPVDGGWIRGLI